LVDKRVVIAQRWCAAQGENWAVLDKAGRGGTAPVYSVRSPNGLRALKIYDRNFSVGEKGEREQLRVAQQVLLRNHSCPSLVQIYDGGRFEDRLFVLMSKAPGSELEKRLANVPRERIRHIVDQVARAMIFLRDRGMCHRDVKSANIFVTDDCETVTLLDLSVVREIDDPVGLGTDHGDQLPVVATARYSPPEYLFRLLEPGDDLWHALDVYQLGALLHDLIMKKPMFQDEYKRSSQNRYRSAWTVATIDPFVSAQDVDRDLISIAHRARV
jgi:serine/threonine protein kinase